MSRNAADQHEELEEELYIEKDGYMETFLVNETEEDVWYDNFSVQSTTALIVQETHYDPWGVELEGLGYQYGGIKTNKYLYQGKEFLDDHNMNIYDFHARGYDPVLGRTIRLDPHAENYFSLSPYSWTANNPTLFTDPDGKDITFYVWEGDKKKKVGFEDLDVNIQKALESFAKTEVGNQFLGQFANKDDKIGSVEFTETGKYAKYEMAYEQFGTPGAAPGTHGFENTRESGLKFYTRINSLRPSDERNPESFAITLGHESFLHMDQYYERLIKAYERKDGRAYNNVRHERTQISRDRNGRPEHIGYLNKETSYSKMYNFLNQLRKVLNPAQVDRQRQKHDERLKKNSIY